MAIAVLLKERYREMCGIQTMLSLVLFTSRVQKQVGVMYVLLICIPYNHITCSYNRCTPNSTT